MIARLKERIRRDRFFPTWTGILLNPFYFARKGLAENIGLMAHHLTGRILDIGCGQKTYEHLFVGCTEYVGLEIDTPGNRISKKADFYYDGVRLPFPDHWADSVLISQVLEHVFEPDSFLREVYRIAKPGAKVLMTVPFIWDEHEQPYDYARYTSFGLSAIVKRNGFHLIEVQKSASGVKAICQIINACFYKVSTTRYTLINFALCLVLMGPINIIGILLGIVLPACKDIYLNNIVLMIKPLH